MFSRKWSNTPTSLMDDYTLLRLVVRYSGKKFMVVVPCNASFRDVKEEIARVYQGINPAAPTETVAEVCDSSGCILFDDYLVGVLLTDLSRIYAFKRGEEDVFTRASTPLPFGIPTEQLNARTFTHRNLAGVRTDSQPYNRYPSSSVFPPEHSNGVRRPQPQFSSSYIHPLATHLETCGSVSPHAFSTSSIRLAIPNPTRSRPTTSHERLNLRDDLNMQQDSSSPPQPSIPNHLFKVIQQSDTGSDWRSKVIQTQLHSDESSSAEKSEVLPPHDIYTSDSVNESVSKVGLESKRWLEFNESKSQNTSHSEITTRKNVNSNISQVRGTQFAVPEKRAPAYQSDASGMYKRGRIVYLESGCSSSDEFRQPQKKSKKSKMVSGVRGAKKNVCEDNTSEDADKITAIKESGDFLVPSSNQLRANIATTTDHRCLQPSSKSPQTSAMSSTGKQSSSPNPSRGDSGFLSDPKDDRTDQPLGSLSKLLPSSIVTQDNINQLSPVGDLTPPNISTVGGLTPPNTSTVGGLTPNISTVGGLTPPNPSTVGGLTPPNTSAVGGLTPNTSTVGGLTPPNTSTKNAKDEHSDVTHLGESQELFSEPAIESGDHFIIGNAARLRSSSPEISLQGAIVSTPVETKVSVNAILRSQFGSKLMNNGSQDTCNSHYESKSSDEPTSILSNAVSTSTDSQCGSKSNKATKQNIKISQKLQEPKSEKFVIFSVAKDDPRESNGSPTPPLKPDECPRMRRQFQLSHKSTFAPSSTMLLRKRKKPKRVTLPKVTRSRAKVKSQVTPLPSLAQTDAEPQGRLDHDSVQINDATEDRNKCFQVNTKSTTDHTSTDCNPEPQGRLDHDSVQINNATEDRNKRFQVNTKSTTDHTSTDCNAEPQGRLDHDSVQINDATEDRNKRFQVNTKSTTDHTSTDCNTSQTDAARFPEEAGGKVNPSVDNPSKSHSTSDSWSSSSECEGDRKSNKPNAQPLVKLTDPDSDSGSCKSDTKSSQKSNQNPKLKAGKSSVQIRGKEKSSSLNTTGNTLTNSMKSGVMKKGKISSLKSNNSKVDVIVESSSCESSSEWDSSETEGNDDVVVKPKSSVEMVNQSNKGTKVSAVSSCTQANSDTTSSSDSDGVTAPNKQVTSECSKKLSSPSARKDAALSQVSKRSMSVSKQASETVSLMSQKPVSTQVGSKKRFLFTSRVRVPVLLHKKVGALKNSSAHLKKASPVSDNDDSSSDTSSSDESSDESTSKEKQKQKSHKTSSLTALLDGGPSVYHPKKSSGSTIPFTHQSFTNKSFTESFSGSLDKLRDQHKPRPSNEVLHKRKDASSRDLGITNIAMSQEEVEYAKTGSQNLTSLLDNEQFWK